MKVALYCRVSRTDLNNENQLLALKRRCKAMEFEDYEIFLEVMSSRKTRPTKAELMKRLRANEFEVLMFTRLDRFARSSQELTQDVKELVASGIRVIVTEQGMDFQRGNLNSVGTLQLQILSAFAEFERELIRERTLEGLARAKAQGKKLGRHFKDPEKQKEALRLFHEQHMSKQTPPVNPNDVSEGKQYL